MCAAPQDFLKQAIELAVESVKVHGGGPFGALIVKDDHVVGTGINLVTASNDPTAHAEVVAIRAACEKLKTFELSGCEIYCSCEPCPMCLGAIYWARAKRFYFSANRADAARAGFDDSLIYNEVSLAPAQRSIPGTCLPVEDSLQPFDEWAHAVNRVLY
jgi:tRNA(Arg) A34 adenosine deaminase TadA